MSSAHWARLGQVSQILPSFDTVITGGTMSQMTSSASSRSSGRTVGSPRLSLRLSAMAGEGGGLMRCERLGVIDASQSARQNAPLLRGSGGAFEHSQVLAPMNSMSNQMSSSMP
eukprot:CAMPEP_0179949218 /NCGR_PEP_ID=MMETSP0983-20121128/22207_1 /TAXON_ID=483367 /ORGANISM="non described non described, Strain CCMP 2436" /LENGTH=113 /DNA_ID=CAMNT_0021858921 /DNA_START=187 /DNA_END=524 /DNA_ORIENTATION=+